MTNWKVAVVSQLLVAQGMIIAAFAADPPPRTPTHKLTVDVTGVATQSGEITIALFTTKEGFPDDLSKATRSGTVPAKTPKHTFEDLPPGKYVVLVFHDQNSNKRLDKSLLGLPKEPIGLSNYQSIGPTSLPDFKKAQIDFNSDRTAKIKLLSPPG